MLMFTVFKGMKKRLIKYLAAHKLSRCILPPAVSECVNIQVYPSTEIKKQCEHEISWARYKSIVPKKRWIAKLDSRWERWNTALLHSQ